MFENPSLATHITVGKLVGMALGLVGLMTIPYLWPDLGWVERIRLSFPTRDTMLYHEITHVARSLGHCPLTEHSTLNLPFGRREFID